MWWFVSLPPRPSTPKGKRLGNSCCLHGWPQGSGGSVNDSSLWGCWGSGHISRIGTSGTVPLSLYLLWLSTQMQETGPAYLYSDQSTLMTHPRSFNWANLMVALFILILSYYVFTVCLFLWIYKYGLGQTHTHTHTHIYTHIYTHTLLRMTLDLPLCFLPSLSSSKCLKAAVYFLSLQLHLPLTPQVTERECCLSPPSWSHPGWGH